MPKYPARSLTGNPNDKDIHFTAEEIPHFKDFGTAGDRFYKFARIEDVRKGNYPHYGVRVDAPWRFVGFEPANGWMFYRFTQDEMDDDPKWAVMKAAEAVLGEPTNEYFSPERIREVEGR